MFLLPLFSSVCLGFRCLRFEYYTSLFFLVYCFLVYCYLLHHCQWFMKSIYVGVVLIFSLLHSWLSVIISIVLLGAPRYILKSFIFIILKEVRKSGAVSVLESSFPWWPSKYMLFFASFLCMCDAYGFFSLFYGRNCRQILTGVTYLFFFPPCKTYKLGFSILVS